MFRQASAYKQVIKDEAKNPKDAQLAFEGNAVLVARGTGVSAIGLLAKSGLDYLVLLVIARSVGPTLFGQFNLTMAVVTSLAPVALLGLNIAALRFVARSRALKDWAGETWTIRTTVLLVAMWASLLGLGLIVLAEPVSKLLELPIWKV